MNEFWNNLSESERRTAIVGGAVAVLLLLYMIVWDPLAGSVTNLRKATQQQREDLIWLKNAADEVKTLQRAKASGGGAQRGGQSLLAIVDQTARRDNLATALKRIEPKGANEVRVRFEGAGFDEMIQWLTTMQRNYGVIIDTVAIDREAQVGRVNANLTLKDAAP